MYCRVCGQVITKEREVLDKGKVYSYTMIHVPPTEYAHIAPYIVALVQLQNSTVKLTVRILGDVNIGDEVELDKFIDGAYVYKKIS